MARHQRRRAAVRAPNSSPDVELAPDSARPRARMLYVDGVPQSYVDMADPTYLRPDGIYTVNLTDLPPLGHSRVQAATLRAVFPDVCLIAGRAMLRGRRYGNIVLAAAREPGRLPVARLTTRALRDPVAGFVLHGAALDRFVAGARPLRDPRPTDAGLA